MFLDCWKVSSTGVQLKTTALLVFFLWLVIFEKLVNSRLLDHLEKHKGDGGLAKKRGQVFLRGFDTQCTL